MYVCIQLYICIYIYIYIRIVIIIIPGLLPVQTPFDSKHRSTTETDTKRNSRDGGSGSKNQKSCILYATRIDTPPPINVYSVYLK